jgi:nitrogen regulatory protein PII
LQFDARGTLAHDRWYQAFIPMVNPENEYLQFIVSGDNVDDFMSYLVRVAQLHLPGAGGAYSVPCLSYASDSEKFVNRSDVVSKDIVEQPINFKKNLSVVFALIQSGRTEPAIRAAMQAGSHGPIVYYAEGRGTRDRMGWLKITKKPYEEVIMTIVDKVDKDSVIDAIVNAGNINVPGGGILYDLPISKGIVNFPTSVGKRSELATTHQMVAALDELMGSSDWRDRRALARDDKQLGGESSSTNGGNTYLLRVLVPRKYVHTIMDAAIEFGAPGTNVTYVKKLASHADVDESGFTMHEEMGFIRMVLSQSLSVKIRDNLKYYCTENNINNVLICELAVNKVIRYRSEQ